eukprot:812212-Amphidinium_carterae.1
MEFQLLAAHLQGPIGCGIKNNSGVVAVRVLDNSSSPAAPAAAFAASCFSVAANTDHPAPCPNLSPSAYRLASTTTTAPASSLGDGRGDCSPTPAVDRLSVSRSSNSCSSLKDCLDLLAWC